MVCEYVFSKNNLNVFNIYDQFLILKLSPQGFPSLALLDLILIVSPCTVDFTIQSCVHLHPAILLLLSLSLP